MKHYILLLLALFIAPTTFAQHKDTRAVLDIHGLVNEISVSQHEKVWVVTGTGQSYYADSIDSNWHEGQSNNYRYSLHNHTPEIYFLQHPIKNFLTSPITSFSINEGSQGCFHCSTREVRYDRTTDSTFETAGSSLKSFNDTAFVARKGKVNAYELLYALEAIDEDPAFIPSVEDFNITESDRKNYLHKVNKSLNAKRPAVGSSKKKIDKKFYYSVPAMLDTLDRSVIKDMLDEPENLLSTTHHWLTIQIVNQSGDTLSLSVNYYTQPRSWCLPWKCEYKGLQFNSYHIGFSKYVSDLPINFVSPKVFDNSYLLFELANYLWNKE